MRGDGAGVQLVPAPDEPESEARPGSALVDDTRRAAAGTGVVVRQVACLGNCRRGLTAAVFRTGCWSYVFGGLEATSGADSGRRGAALRDSRPTGSCRSGRGPRR